MSLFEDIKDLAGGKSQNPSWWRSQFQYGLEGLTPSAEPGSTGRMLFFTYRAEYGEKYRFWDVYPLVYILGEDSTHFWGGNLHYVEPEYRTIVGADLASGNKIVPKETLHKYLRKNVLSATYDVPSTEWPDVGLIPCEQFVTTINGRNIPIPSKHVY